MGYGLLKLAHVFGAIVMGAGLVAVWVADLRSRQVRELVPFAEAVRFVAVFYDGLVVPGALLLLASGAWLVAVYYGGLDAFRQPWLAGMALLFLIEFVEGNTVTRLYFMRLRRLTIRALEHGRFTTELTEERTKVIPSFTHFLDLPVLALIVALGVLRPSDWTVFLVGSAAAVALGLALTWWIQQRYPWSVTDAT
jgi:hypothetical protein